MYIWNSRIKTVDFFCLSGNLPCITGWWFYCRTWTDKNSPRVLVAGKPARKEIPKTLTPQTTYGLLIAHSCIGSSIIPVCPYSIFTPPPRSDSVTVGLISHPHGCDHGGWRSFCQRRLQSAVPSSSPLKLIERGKVSIWTLIWSVKALKYNTKFLWIRANLVEYHLPIDRPENWLWRNWFTSSY